MWSLRPDDEAPRAPASSEPDKPKARACARAPIFNREMRRRWQLSQIGSRPHSPSRLPGRWTSCPALPGYASAALEGCGLVPRAVEIPPLAGLSVQPPRSGSLCCPLGPRLASDIVHTLRTGVCGYPAKCSTWAPRRFFPDRTRRICTVRQRSPSRPAPNRPLCTTSADFFPP